MPHLKLYCVFVTSFLFLQKAHPLSPPKVAISFPSDIADVDFQNSTFSLISNSYPVFELVCLASYPVEWVPFYELDDDGTSEQKKDATTRRIVTNFTNPDTYTFSANLSLQYNGKLFVFSNFSCRSTQNESLQTNVILIPKERKNIIIMNITSDPLYSLIKVKPDTSGNCKTYTSVSDLDRNSSCWKCEKADGTDLELDFIGCTNAIECNSIYQRQNLGKRCLKVLRGPQNDTRHCRQIGAHDYNPKTLVCKNYGAVLTQLYFFGIPKTSKAPNIYFDWSEIDPLDMIYIRPLRPILFYGENVTITCEMSRYYFSFGSWLGLRHGNGSITYLQTPNHVEDSSRGTFVSELELNLSYLGLSEVICFGPVWNSVAWVNTSVTLNVRNGTAPSVMSITTDSLGKVFIIGQRNRSLTCTFKGEPMPKVTWVGPSGGYFQVEESYENHSSTLVFPEMTYVSSGEYKCFVKSFLGVEFKYFIVHAEEESSKSIKTIISLTALFVAILLVVVGCVMIRLYRVIKSQREALRLLTEAEIKEFEDGNPEFVSKNDYFDRNMVIEALPYDKRFEVSPENITIDKNQLLGCGAFGKVYKGKLKTLRISNTNNKTTPPLTQTEKFENSISFEKRSSKTSEGDVLAVGAGSREGIRCIYRTVAVKTCDTSVDVMYFKALLSEVKIMAYIGHHKNILGLIGACTRKIRNREVYIAIEFCPKGSLESFLKKHCKSFQSKVQYGMIVEPGNSIIRKGSISATYTTFQVTEMADIILTTVDLIKWIFDMCCGMEFLHEKKVIHGDLATRNILLTEDLVAKIGDFGLARQLFECSNYVKKTQTPLPWRHLSPESLRNLEFSLASDIWALGITIWEIFTLSDLPYPGLTYDADFLRNLQKGVRLNKPIYATNDFYEYMLKCWTFNPEGRPMGFEEAKNLCVQSLKLLVERENLDSGETPSYLEMCTTENNLGPKEDASGYLIPNSNDNIEEVFNA